MGTCSNGATLAPAIVDLEFLGGNEHFEPISGMQFLHQDCHVILDSLLAYSQPDGYFAVGPPPQQEPDDLLLTYAQLDRTRSILRIEAVLNASTTLYAKLGVM